MLVSVTVTMLIVTLVGAIMEVTVAYEVRVETGATRTELAFMVWVCVSIMVLVSMVSQIVSSRLARTEHAEVDATGALVVEEATVTVDGT